MKKQTKASVTVDHEHKPRLYRADGTPLVRQAGFTAGRDAQEQDMKKQTKKGKGGGRGC